MKPSDPPERQAYTLPREPGVEELKPAGVVCPDCCGTLQVRVEGRRHLLFICRIGHSYDLTTLLEAKEADIERRAWSAVLGYEEMAAILHDLVRYRYIDHDSIERFRPREQAAHEIAQHFRGGIQRDVPLRLSEREAGPATASE